MLKGTNISTLPINFYLTRRPLPGEDLEVLIGEQLSKEGFDGAFQVNRETGTVTKFRWSTEPDPYDYLDENGDWGDDWECQSRSDYAPLYRTYETCGARSY